MELDMNKLNILVTGAARGMGYEISKALAPHCSVLLGTSRNRSIDDPNLVELDKISDKFSYIAQDLSEGKRAAENIREWASGHIDKLDVLVLNAGFYTEGDLENFSESYMRENLEVNFLVNFFLAQEFHELLKRSQRRRIVIIGSTAAYEPYPLVPSYGVAKWALRGLAINLRKEFAKSRIGVTYISPGATWTDMWEGEDLPRNRLLEPSDIAKAVQLVVSTSEQAVIEELIVRPMDGDFHE